MVLPHALVPSSGLPYRNAGTNLTNLACDFGAIDPLQGLGLQIAALSDTDPHYAGSCGCTTTCLKSHPSLLRHFHFRFC